VHVAAAATKQRHWPDQSSCVLSGHAGRV